MNIVRNVRWSALVDHGAFSASVLLGQIFVFHGKAVADFVFNRGKSYLMGGFNNTASYAIAIMATGCIVVLRIWPSDLSLKVPITLLLVLLVPAITQATSTWPAMMVFFLHLYFLTVAAIIVLAEGVFSQKLQKRFWSLLFDRIFRAIRYILILFTAGLAVLRYLSAGLQEPPAGFLTSLFYPTTVLILTLGMLVQWLLVPAWRKMIESYQEEERKPRVRSARKQSAITGESASSPAAPADQKTSLPDR